MKRWLVLLEIEYIKEINDGYIDGVDGGGNLDAIPDNTSVREEIDGKEFGEVDIRETYIDKEF